MRNAGRVAQLLTLWLVSQGSASAGSWVRTYPATTFSRLAWLPDGFTLTNATTTGGFAKLMRMDASGVAEWSSTYRTPTNTAGRYTFANGSGGLVLFGYHAASSNQLAVLSLDAVGRVVSGTAVSLADSGGYPVVPTVDGNFAILTPPVVAKVTPTGQPLWAQSFNGTNFGILNVAGTMDGGVVLVGTTTAVLAKLDSAGSLQWSKRYERAFSNVWGQAVLEQGDGTYIVAARVEATTNDDDVWVAKVTSTGGILWQQTFTTPENEEPIDIARLSDNSIAVLIQSQQNLTTNTLRAEVLNLDQAGQIQWQMLYTDAAWDITVESIKVVSDGFAIMAHYRDSGGPSRGLIIKANLDGSLDNCTLDVPASMATVARPLSEVTLPLSATSLSLTAQSLAITESSTTPSDQLECQGGCGNGPITQVKAVKRGSDAVLSWALDASANGYNLWHVTSKALIDQARQSTSPPAIAVAACTPVTGTTCTDSGAVPRSSPATFFYQVRAYCDASTEGP